MKVLYSVLLVLALIAAALITLRTPSNERVFKDYLARPTSISFSNDGREVTFGGVRDWTYDEQGPTSKEYVTRTYALDSITGMRFVVEPFPENPSFGHTLLIFDFENAPPLAFSVEAKLEEGEDYNPWIGLLNAYELAYTWGTEEDFLTRRSVMLGHDVYVYTLEVTPQIARAVFTAVMEGSIELEKSPRFYNTFAHNCTNELSRLINAQIPDALSWNWSRVFTGTADKHLYGLGYIAGSSWEEVHENARITR